VWRHPRRLAGRCDGRRTTAAAGPAPVLIRPLNGFGHRGRRVPMPAGDRPNPMSEMTRETHRGGAPGPARRRFPDRPGDRPRECRRADPNLQVRAVGKRGARTVRPRPGGVVAAGVAREPMGRETVVRELRGRRRQPPSGTVTEPLRRRARVARRSPAAMRAPGFSTARTAGSAPAGSIRVGQRLLRMDTGRTERRVLSGNRPVRALHDRPSAAPRPTRATSPFWGATLRNNSLPIATLSARPSG